MSYQVTVSSQAEADVLVEGTSAEGRKGDGPSRTVSRPTTRRTSVAVMARRTEPADSLDYFPTPPWATRAFCELVMPHVWPWPDVFKGEAWDPACGEGHMAVALAEYFDRVMASDIFDYGYGHVADFLDGAIWQPREWIITNPPFNRAEEFVSHALTIAERGVAMLVRTQFLEGQGRFRDLFSRRPPQAIAQFVERVPMHKGRWDPKGKTATAYCWVVWLRHPPHDWKHTRFLWIPPCRARLTRRDDAMRFNAAADVPLLAGETTVDDVKAELEKLL